MKTIEVVPHIIGIMPDGTRASRFSSGLSHTENTGKYTWRVIDHTGQVTVGLCRQPAATAEEARQVAGKVADIRGFDIIGE